MSQENVETLRAFIETWSREWTLEAWQRGEVMEMSFVDPDVIYEDAVLPDHIGEAYRGHEGWLRAAKTWIEPFEWLRIELERIVDAGDRLVSIHRIRSRARHTGIEFDSRDGDVGLAYLWTLRGGKVVHLRAFVDPEEALEAAGLSEKAMSQENVEIVRRALAVLAPDTREAALTLADPEIVIDASRNVFNPGIYEGIDGARQMLANMDETWEVMRVEPGELIDAGDRVVVLGRLVGKGKGSGVEVERFNGQIWTVRRGRVVRLEVGFTDRDAALEAAGLSE